MIIADEQTFKAEVFDYTAGKLWNYIPSVVTLFYFSSAACGGCAMTAPVLHSVGMKRKVQILKIEREKCPHVFALFRIRETPALIKVSTEGQMSRIPTPILEDTLCEILDE